jgi:hypothetical protein
MMGETSYGRSRNLSVNWEFSKLNYFCRNETKVKTEMGYYPIVEFKKVLIQPVKLILFELSASYIKNGWQDRI